MPYNAAIPRELAKKISHSAAVARVRVRWERYGFANNKRSRKKAFDDLANVALDKLTQAQKRRVTPKKLLKLIGHAALEKLNYQYSREYLFCCLRQQQDTNIPSELSFEEMPVLRKTILAALNHKDLEFFRSLGRALSQKPAKERRKDTTALEEFLIEHWCEAKDKVPPLFNLSIIELNDQCNKHTGAGNLTYDTTEKLRQRLGLISFRPGSAKNA